MRIIGAARARGRALSSSGIGTTKDLPDGASPAAARIRLAFLPATRRRDPSAFTPFRSGHTCPAGAAADSFVDPCIEKKTALRTRLLDAKPPTVRTPGIESDAVVLAKQAVAVASLRLEAKPSGIGQTGRRAPARGFWRRLDPPRNRPAIGEHRSPPLRERSRRQRHDHADHLRDSGTRRHGAVRRRLGRTRGAETPQPRTFADRCLSPLSPVCPWWRWIQRRLQNVRPDGRPTDADSRASGTRG